MYHERIDMTGEVVGRLTVVEFAGIGKQKRALWRCICECGKEKIVAGTLLRAALKGRASSVQSCGCLRIQSVTKTILKVNKEKSCLEKQKAKSAR
jgi:hypothetical protein